MTEIHQEIKIRASRERVFAALTTAEGLRGWISWQVGGQGKPGDTWLFEFAERPALRWEVTESTPLIRVAWQCVGGASDTIGTVAVVKLFQCEPADTLVELTHSGWPGTGGNYPSCNATWGSLLHHLKQYVETGVPSPALF